MSNDSSTDAAARVLWVLADEQRIDHQAEIESARRPGVKFVFQSSPEDALEEVSELRPQLVVVGMTNDEMDGLEFLALLMRPKLAFAGRVIVLPDKGDPYPPMLQWRDAETGRSATEEITLEDLGKHVAALVETQGETPRRPSAEYYVSSDSPSESEPEPSGDAVPAGLFGSGAAPAKEPARANTVDAKAAKPVGAGAAARPPGQKPSTATRGGVRFPAPAKEERPFAASAARQVDSGVATMPPPSEGPSPDELLAEMVASGASPEEPAEPSPEEPAEPSPEEPAEPSPEELLAETLADLGDSAEPPPETDSAGPIARAEGALPDPGAADELAAVPGSEPEPPVAAPKRSRWAEWIVASALVAGALVVGGVVFLQMGDAPAPDPTPDPGGEPSGPTELPPDDPAPPPAPPDEPVEEPPPTDPAEEPTDPDPPPALASELFLATTLPVRFNAGAARFRIQDDARMAEIMGQLHAALAEHPDAVVEVGGHTSPQGSDEVNQTLGRRRAAQVRDYFVDHDIPLERIVLRNYYSSSPAEQSPDLGQGVHRRVTVRVID